MTAPVALRRVWKDEVQAYALANGWSANGAKWLAFKDWWVALETLAVSERRAPVDVQRSIIELAVQQEPKRGRRAGE